MDQFPKRNAVRYTTDSYVVLLTFCLAVGTAVMVRADTEVRPLFVICTRSIVFAWV